MKLLICFYADVNERTCNELINFILNNIISAWSWGKVIEEIIIQVSSMWGSSEHWFQIYNFLKQLSLPITTIATWNVDSAAVMIYAAGRMRIAMNESRFTLHQSRMQLNWDFISEKLKETAQILDTLNTNYANILARISGRKTSEMKKITLAWKVLWAKEALKFWLINEIREEAYLTNMWMELQLHMIQNIPKA